MYNTLSSFLDFINETENNLEKINLVLQDKERVPLTLNAIDGKFYGVKDMLSCDVLYQDIERIGFKSGMIYVWLKKREQEKTADDSEPCRKIEGLL